ncbi:MAG: DUF1499 domain-containing protein [Sphingorhabdus sp.]
MSEEELNTEVADEAAAKRGVTLQRDWQTWIIVIAAAGAALWGLIGPVGSGLGLWHFGTAIGGMFWSFWISIGAALFGILFVWLGRRAGKPRRPLLWLAILVAVLYAGWLMSLASKAEPRIHDISTDLADPPAFQVLKLREDNLDNIPGADADDMRGLSPLQRWDVIHKEAYGDIDSVRINQPVNEVMAKAERLAKARGWDIAVFVPEQGRLEATETSALFRFKDDVVLRVRPTENGTGSIIDMRSISRVGQSDLGVNAKRVKAFLADLSGTVTTG